MATHHHASKRVLAAAAALLAGLAVPGLVLANAYPSVLVRNQKVKADTISITYANLPKAGTLAIFEAGAKGGPGRKEIGHVALAAGDHRQVKVKLDQMPRTGTRLWAVIEPAGSSKPFMFEGEAAEQSFKVM